MVMNYYIELWEDRCGFGFRNVVQVGGSEKWIKLTEVKGNPNDS